MENLAIIFSLILIEGLLSLDNALVLAIMVRALPDKKLQKRALTWGIWGAFVFRFVGLLVASHLMRLAFFQILGGGYLLYIAIKHFIKCYFVKNPGTTDAHKPATVSKLAFWKVVVAVELTDIAFSIDSIITALAFSRKLWVVYTGAVLGIITMRMVAGLFIKILDKYPAFFHTGYIMVAWVGLKLVLECLHEHYHIMFMIPKTLFWSVMAVVFIMSFFIKMKRDPVVDSEMKEYEKIESEDEAQSETIEKV